MKQNTTFLAFILFLLLCCAVLLFGFTGCANSLRQSDVEQAFDNSLQRYSQYNAKAIGYETALALTGLSILGEVVLTEPPRPISDSVLAEAVLTGTLLAKLLPGHLTKPLIPQSLNFVPTGHGTIYYCFWTSAGTLILLGLAFGVYKCIQAVKNFKKVLPC